MMINNYRMTLITFNCKLIPSNSPSSLFIAKPSNTIILIHNIIHSTIHVFQDHQKSPLQPKYVQVQPEKTKLSI